MPGPDRSPAGRRPSGRARRRRSGRRVAGERGRHHHRHRPRLHPRYRSDSLPLSHTRRLHLGNSGMSRPRHWSRMYLHKLKVANLKLLRDMTIPFLHEGSRASGPSSLARMASARPPCCGPLRSPPVDPSAATSWGRPSSHHADKRQEDATVTIEATFGFSQAFHGTRSYPDWKGRL